MTATAAGGANARCAATGAAGEEAGGDSIQIMKLDH